ncbi:phenylacetate--CoA ligase family protein [Pseudoduganella violaceinigra]|uniref:phenylacetate--CoA ligase family protein n=1 Tax=Pseudoduganella violaceinigra TaxID=246602 RepID=UPI000409D6A3|nr:phenylacetate--CoA ligase family protein [Pseudoduganella violaceinigra]
MLAELRKEFLYGGRALVRDNALSQRLVRRLRGHELMDDYALKLLGDRLLHRTLQAAIDRLPYYAHIPRDFSPVEARQVLREMFPVIDKTALLDHPRALYPNGGARRPWQVLGKTSGTTGTPLVLIRSLQSVQMEQAFIKRHWSWGGYVDGMPRATLRGDMVAGLEQQAPPFWFENRYNRQLLLSSRHLTDRCIDPIIDKLRGYAPAMMQAYPSTAYTLAQQLERRGMALHVPFLFTASEPLYPHQQELIRERLAGRIMDMYGMAERVALATQCEYGSLHLNTDYSHVEILDEYGEPTNGYGHVVGTTLHNLAMPLVRYRLSDRTRWKPGRCACGRPFPMIEAVTGKLEDRITGGDGAEVSPSVLTFAFKGVENIRKSQVAQVGPGLWELRLVPDANFSQVDVDKLLHNIRALVDATVQVRVVLRDELPNTAAGKFRWVVNEWEDGRRA